MAVTGQDPGAGERGYTDELGAAVGLRKFGGVSGIGDALFGVLVPVLLSRVGDVGLVTSEGRDSLAVCNGDTWLAPGADGLVALPLRAATRAWRF